MDKKTLEFEKLKIEYETHKHMEINCITYILGISGLAFLITRWQPLTILAISLIAFSILQFIAQRRQMSTYRKIEKFK